MEPSLLRKLREGRLLVVPSLREKRQRLLAQDVDAGVDPVIEQRRLAEAGDRAIDFDLDHTERRAHLRHDEGRRGTALLVLGEKRRIVDVEELVPVQREHWPRLLAPRRRKPEAAAAAEWLLLPHRLDLRPHPRQRL